MRSVCPLCLGKLLVSFTETLQLNRKEDARRSQDRILSACSLAEAQMTPYLPVSCSFLMARLRAQIRIIDQGRMGEAVGLSIHPIHPVLVGWVSDSTMGGILNSS